MVNLKVRGKPIKFSRTSAYIAVLLAATMAIVGIKTLLPAQAAPQPLNLWSGPHGIDAMANDPNPVIRQITAQPSAQWIGEWTPNPATNVSEHVRSAAGKIVVEAVYGFPRDGYSAGGFADRQTYLNWVQSAVNGAGSAPVWWIVEPDALGLLPEGQAAKAEQLQTLNLAVSILDTTPNHKMYIEAAAWIDSPELAQRLISANIAKADGFALNVSAFNSTPDMYAKGDEIIAELAKRGITGKKYVIDTSRNGNGPLTAATPHANDWLSRSLDWLNPPARGAGLSPRIPGDNPNCAALLWIKGVGESDGNDPGSSWTSAYFATAAPPAGTLWPEWVRDFAAHTNVANLTLSSTAALTGDLNGDNIVNLFDLSMLLSKWGTPNTAYDLNRDGVISVFDLSIMLSHWTY